MGLGPMPGGPFVEQATAAPGEHRNLQVKMDGTHPELVTYIKRLVREGYRVTVEITAVMD